MQECILESIAVNRHVYAEVEGGMSRLSHAGAVACKYLKTYLETRGYSESTITPGS